MALARPACTPQLFSASADSADAEFGRVLRTTDPGPAMDGPLTFLPAADASPSQWLESWRGWQQATLSPVLAPVLLQTSLLATNGSAREMLALDRSLDASFEPTVQQRSRTAGQRLLARLAASRGERWLGKFQGRVDAGEATAHFPVIYAGQHALFHLPLRLLLPAYAYWEWSAAMSARPPAGDRAPDFADEAHRLLQVAQMLLPSLSSIYARDLPAASGDR